MRRRVALLAIFIVALMGSIRSGRAEEPAPGNAKVTYVSGTSVYIDAGADEGLAIGDIAELIRDGAPVGKFKVTYVTSHKATCSSDGPIPEVKIGDVLRFAPRPRPAVGAAVAGAGAGAGAGAADAIPDGTSSAATKANTSRSGESAFRRAGMRARIGVRYLWVKDRSGIGQDISQPSLDLLLVGSQIGSAPVDLIIDARARRTYLTSTSGASSDFGVDHIYQANVAWRPGPFRLAFGRLVSPTLAVVSLFDGLVAEYLHRGFSVGVLAGTQPNPVTYRYSSDVRQSGLYGGWTSDAAKTTRWHVGLGAIGSKENGEINRDFTYVEGRVTHPVVTAYVQQQVDINRGWRKEEAGTSVTPSATVVMIHVRPAPSWTVDGGYDSRRNVLLYPDLVTPVTNFDDATRQGYWLGAAWRPENRWLVGVDARRWTGGTAGTATSYTLRLGALNMTKEQIDVQLRGTSYTGPGLEGYLVAASASMNLGSRVRLDLHGGVRQDSGFLSASATETIDWYGTLLDVYIARSMYFNLSYDVTSGGEENNDQGYAAFSWRF
jgi:hypothetical protein